jgi:hypothetical protein
MDIQIATLCDFAADYNGKMVVSGTIDVLAAPALPIVQPHCCLALRLCITPEDNGAHKFTVNIIDGDGKSIDAKMPIKADMPVDLPEDVPFLHRNLILNLQGLKFNEVGVYFIDVSIDGDVIQRLPLRVIKMDAKNNQQPPVA